MKYLMKYEGIVSKYIVSKETLDNKKIVDIIYDYIQIHKSGIYQSENVEDILRNVFIALNNGDYQQMESILNSTKEDITLLINNINSYYKTSFKRNFEHLIDVYNFVIENNPEEIEDCFISLKDDGIPIEFVLYSSTYGNVYGIHAYELDIKKLNKSSEYLFTNFKNKMKKLKISHFESRYNSDTGYFNFHMELR